MGYDRFDALCKSRNVTPYQVSKATGVSTATISSWKVGRYTPKRDKMQKLADYFGVSVDYFLYDEMNTSDDSDHTSAQSVHYTDPEAAQIAQAVFDDPNLRLLFGAAEDCAPDQIRLAAEMLKKFKEGR